MNAKLASISENLIEFHDVAYHINDIPARTIVSEISLRIPPGETLVLLGRSGSGKTTLLKLINGMLLPPKGVVLVQNRATTEWDPIRLRRGIGYVIQEAGLFPISRLRRTSPSFPLWKTGTPLALPPAYKKCFISSALIRATLRIASPANFPAASVSAWGSHAPSPLILRYY